MFGTIIQTGELAKLLQVDRVVMVDVRFYLADVKQGRAEYEALHVEGAHYAHLNEDLSGTIVKGKTGRHPLPDAREFIELVERWGVDQDTQVVVYDQGHGGIAARLWWMFRWIGHVKVAVVEGGWPKLKQSSIPLSASKTPEHSSTRHGGTALPSMVWSMSDLEKAMEEEAVTLVDARDGARYRGEIEPIDPVAGHIPGAISLPFKENMTDDFTWCDQATLASRFQALEAKQASQMAFYCGSGVTACHNILAMVHAGYDMPKLYPGSWSEWIIHHEVADR